MGIRTMGHPVHSGEPRDFVAAVDALYTALRSTLKGTGTSYDRILSRWTTYLPQVCVRLCASVCVSVCVNPLPASFLSSSRGGRPGRPHRPLTAATGGGGQVEAAVCDVESKLMQALLDDCGGAIRRDSVPKASALQTVRTRSTPGGRRRILCHGK